MNEHTDAVGIEAALNVLLRAAVQSDENRPERDPAKPIAVSVADLGDLKTPQQAKVAALVRAPIAMACRQAIKVLGQGLYDIGGQDLMQEVAGRVQDHPTQGGRRISILDHAWDGCGKDNDRWWA